MREIEEYPKEEWLSCLKEYQKDIVSTLSKDGIDSEEIARILLSSNNIENNYPYGGERASENLYDAIKNEFSKFICNDPDYEDLRKKVAALWEKGKTPVISAVAVFIGGNLGIAAGVLFPIIAILFSIVSEISTKAWCEARQK